MEKTVEYMVNHIKSLRSMGRHSMVNDVITAMEDMAKGGDGNGSRQYYKGWSDNMFRIVLSRIKE